MKIILVLLFLSFKDGILPAQFTQAEINKMIKEAQTDVEIMKKDPKMKERAA